VPLPLERASTSLEGHNPSGKSPPRSRVLAPRASLHLAPGLPQPATPHLLPDQGIKCPDTPRTPVSKANPRHADLLTQPRNPIPALFEQPTAVQPSPTLYMCCAGWLVSFLGIVLPAPVLSPHRTPRKRTVTPSRSVRPPTRRPSRTTP
jgi:hypothetical protein